MAGQPGTLDQEVKRRKLGLTLDLNIKIKLKELCKGYRTKQAEPSKMMKLLVKN
jgi:hypothetical protein